MKLFLVTFFFSATGMAHIDQGKFIGITVAGDSCEMLVGQNYFENNVAHPLNERIKVNISGVDFVVHHPPVIDVKTQTAAYNHDLFEGIVPTSLGAKGLVITMSHSEIFEGPTEFSLIDHEYKSNKRSVLTCLNLKHE